MTEKTKERKPRATKKSDKGLVDRIEKAEKGYNTEYNLQHPLKGFIQTGLIYVGDPGYLAGTNNILPGDENPFREWDKFTDSLHGMDQVLPFDQFGATGKGVVIQTSHLSGRYEIEKELDDNGKLLSVKVKFFD